MTATKQASAASEAWVLMGRLFQVNKSRFFAIASEFDLSPPQMHALRALDPETPMPMSDLAAELHCDNSNITGIIDRLEDRDLVQRRPAAHDRRVKHLVLTARGAELRERLGLAMAQPPAQLEKLSVAEQRQLRELLRKATS
jgi:DNA-binding MarR family transcriptional regulator